ncbi:MAG: hypothetical protein JWN54_434 [Mycobacterium sp.]|nr:hypothetical protein [Mycobacterium sp.]
MRGTTLARVAVVTALAAVTAGLSGGAAYAEGTPVEVQLGADAGLTITQPTTTATLSGTSTPGAVLTGSLGDTTVTDGRGTLLGWTVTALTEGNLVSTVDPAHTVSLGATPVGGPLTVTVPSVTAIGDALLSGVVPGVGGSLNPSMPVVLATALTGLGGGGYRFDPGLSFTVPPNTYAETYRTVVVQTVA